MSIVNILKRLSQKRMLNKFGKFMQLSDKSVYEIGFSVDLRKPSEGKIYLEVEADCVIGGIFVFETSSGKIKIGKRTLISGSSMLVSKTSIIVGNDVIIAGGTILYDHDSHSVDWELRKNDVKQQVIDYFETGDQLFHKEWENVKTSQIVIEDGVWIGRDVMILKGVTVGNHSVIGARSVVTRDVEPWTLVAGNPAQVIRRLK